MFKKTGYKKFSDNYSHLTSFIKTVGEIVVIIVQKCPFRQQGF